MKKVNDIKIYAAIIISALVITASFGGVSAYSKFIVEPQIITLISSPDTMKEGYLKLREPQIFGGYKYWDSDGMAVKNSLRYFDSKITKGDNITADEKVYLELILKRRASGSELGLKTALFFLIVSLTGFIAYLFEKNSLQKSGE